MPNIQTTPESRQDGVRICSPAIPKDGPHRSSPPESSLLAQFMLPTVVFRNGHHLWPNKNEGRFLDLDLQTPRLNRVHKYLWLAGLPRAARPLHRQKLLGRNISITEDPDEHLVWFEMQLFVKPLPEYLLDYDYWIEHLCSNKHLHESACGLLLSYAWLVCYKSDLEIAKEEGLLPRGIDWLSWVKLMECFLNKINLETLDNVNERYQYGELRLSRLNTIYRVIPPEYSLNNLVRGYRQGSTWYNAFFERHFKWMLAAFALLSVLLSALQVGLATPTLQNNHPFQNASYGFTVASLVAVAASILVVILVWLVLFWFHLASGWRNNQAVARQRHASLSTP